LYIHGDRHTQTHTPFNMAEKEEEKFDVLEKIGMSCMNVAFLYVSLFSFPGGLHTY